MIRWLVALALLDRLLCADARDPLAWPLLRVLCDATLGTGGWQRYQAGLWCAYKLKDAPLLLAIDKLQIITKASGLAKFGETTIQADPVAIERYDARFKSKRIVSKAPTPDVAVTA